MPESKKKAKTLFGNPSFFEKPFSHILSYMDHGYYETDRTGRFVCFNPAFLRILGGTEPEILASDIYTLVDKKDRKRLEEKVLTVTATLEPASGIRYAFSNKKGTSRTGEMSVCPVIDDTGNVSGFSGLLKDHSRIRALEKDLAVNRAGLEQMTASRTLEMKDEVEQKKKIQTINDSLISISSAINTTKNLDELYPVIHHHLNQIIRLDHFYIGILDADKNFLRVQYRVDPTTGPLKDVSCLALEETMAGRVLGKSRPLLMNKKDMIENRWNEEKYGPVPEKWLGVPLTSQNRVIGIMMAYSDDDPDCFTHTDLQILTSVSGQVGFAIERRQILDRLSAREEKYRRLVETTTAGYWQMDKENLTVGVNPALCHMIGYAEQQLIGRKISDFIDAESERIYRIESEKSHTSKNRQYELVFKKRSGERLYANIDATSIFDAEGRFESSFLVMSDITDRILFQKQLHRAKEKAEQASNTTRTILEQLQSGVILVNADTLVIEKVNPAAARMFGRPAEKIIGSGCHDYMCLNDKGSGEACPVATGNEPVVNSEQYLVDARNRRIPILKTVSRVFMKGQPYLLESFVDITEQKRAEKNLVNETRRANELAKAAQEANTAKSQFLANMSHEIRTPLNGVTGMAELLMEGPLDENQKNLLQTIGSEADSLLAIIDTILDFSKIEAGKMDLEEISFDLRQMFEDFSRVIAVRADKAGLDFLSYLDTDIPTSIKGDPGRLRQIFMNLVGNALKFTRKGEIFVKGRLTGQTRETITVLFEGMDTGIGIPKEKQHLVFESFSQADGSTTRKYGGTGLGTTISKQLVTLMGGEIGFESQEGEGSTFWFKIEFRKQKNSLKQACDMEKDLSGTRVLVVENNETHQYIISKYLESLGCEATRAWDGDTGLACLEREKERKAVDILMVDTGLPGMNGFDFAKKIRESDRFNDLSVILMTAAGESGDGRRCREIGINGYLAKPIRKNELKLTLAQVLSSPGPSGARVPRLVTRHSIEEMKTRHAKILVVEDYPTNQQIALKHLRRAGFDVELAENGLNALEWFKKSKFDLILMDIQMPLMDGYEATEKIREIEKRISKEMNGNVRVPVIATTAHAMKGYREKCLRAQMDDYLTKPLKRDDLIAMVEKWITAGNEPETARAGLDGGRSDSPLACGLPIDMKRAMAEFDNDRLFFTDLLEKFIRVVSGQLSLIEKAIQGNDFATIEKNCHSIKGGAANLTAMQLSGAADALEKMGKTRNRRGLDEAFRQLESSHASLAEYTSTLHKNLIIKDEIS